MVKIQKLYYLLFGCLCMGVLLSVSPFQGVKLYLYDFPAIILGFLSLFFLPKFWRKYKRNLIFVLPFLVVGLLGLFFTTVSLSNFLASLSYLARLVLYLLLPLPLLTLSIKNLKRITIAVVFSGFISVLVGFLQYIYYPDLANLYYLGWDRHLYRFFGTFLDPNFTGVYVVCVFILFLSSVSFLALSKQKSRLLYAFGSFIFLSAIFLTYSRSSYIAAFTSITVFFLLTTKKRVALLFFGLFIVVLIMIPKNFGGEGVNLFRTASIVARETEIQHGLTIIAKHPVIGVGFNNLKQVQYEMKYIGASQLQSHAASGIPNAYIFTLATTGFVGFICFILVLWQILKGILTVRKSNPEYRVFSSGVLSCFVAVLVSSLFDNVLYFSPIFILLSVITGVLVGLSLKKK